MNFQKRELESLTLRRNHRKPSILKGFRDLKNQNGTETEPRIFNDLADHQQ